MIESSDRVIVSQDGIKVEATVLATLPYSAFEGMAGQDGTMFQVQSEAWFGNVTWLTEDMVRPIGEKKLEFILDKLA